jgi:uncharacterized membrane protein
MSGLAEIAGLVGLILPMIIAVIQQVQFSQAVRSLVAVAACVVAAIIVAAAQTNFNAHNFAVAFMTVFVSTVVSYEHFWKPTGIAPLVEGFTNINRGAGIK